MVVGNVEQRLGHVGAGARHQHVEPRQVSDDCADALGVGDVAGDRGGLPSKPTNLAGEVVELMCGAAHGNDVRSGLGQRERARPPDAAPGAGHERDPAVEPEAHTRVRRSSRMRAVSAWPANCSASEMAAAAGAIWSVPSAVSRW